MTAMRKCLVMDLQGTKQHELDVTTLCMMDPH